MYAELAVAAAGALVGAVTTESWTWAKESIRGLRRDEGGGSGGNLTATEALIAQVEALGQGTDPAELQALREQWAAQLQELLTRDPDLVPAVKALVEEAARRGVPMAGERGSVNQTVVASDNAQQAVQGRGVQNVSFEARPQS